MPGWFLFHRVRHSLRLGLLLSTTGSCRGVNSRIVDVNCGTYATFATSADGHIYAFGLNNYGQLALPGAHRAGGCHMYALPALLG